MEAKKFALFAPIKKPNIKAVTIHFSVGEVYST